MPSWSPFRGGWNHLISVLLIRFTGDVMFVNGYEVQYYYKLTKINRTDGCLFEFIWNISTPLWGWVKSENRSSGPMVMPHRAHWCPMPWGGYRWGNREERHREVKQQEVTEAELQPGSLLPLSILCTVLRFWDGTQEWTLAQEVRWCLHVISAALGGTLSWAWVSS